MLEPMDDLLESEPVALLEIQEAGLYCAAGDFYIDPWKSVDRALITHAHADHARPGSRHYLCSEDGLGVLRLRMGTSARIESLRYGKTLDFGGVTVSLHPAGHVLGSAQVRVEHRGEIWVASGDYKLAHDSTCRGFEPVRCHTFITESTFGLPIYRWPKSEVVFGEIQSWWAENQASNCTSVLLGYSLGKAQRLLAGLDPGQGPILVHPAVAKVVEAYRAEGIRLPAVEVAKPEVLRGTGGKGIVVASPGAETGPWMDRLGEVATGSASGWMLVRGMRRWGGEGRGFVLSDHADWEGLIGAIRATGAERVLATHGYTKPLVRWLQEQGLQAAELATRFVGERREDVESEDTGGKPGHTVVSGTMVSGEEEP